MLQQQGTRILVTLFVIALAAWVALAFMREGGGSAPESSISLRHHFVNGYHEYRGRAAVPTPCHDLKVLANVSGDVARIDLTVQRNGDFCAQVVSERNFFVRVAAPQNIEPEVTMNGASRAVSVVEE